MAKVLHDGGPLTRNASVAATELIRQAILDGRLNPGQRLKEEELARELGISRTPVREALLMLQAEGLVDATPNRGATVRAHTAHDLDDLYQLRALLERDELDLRELVRENMVFHEAILDGAASARLAAMVRKVIDLPLVYRSYIWYSPEQQRISGHYHVQITRALEARDAERAEMIMKEHIFEARDHLVAHVRELEAAE